MKKIPNSFKLGGYSFTLLRRAGDVALFKKTKPGVTPSYEVVIVRRHVGRTIAGIAIQPAEYMPSSDEWGRYGWTDASLEAATRRFEEQLQCHSLRRIKLPEPFVSSARVTTADNTNKSLAAKTVTQESTL